MAQRSDLLLTAKVLEAKARLNTRILISARMALQLAQLCRDLAWQEDEVA